MNGGIWGSIFGGVPKPSDFFKFSVARAAGQGWLWQQLAQGINPTAAMWNAIRSGLMWDRSEFFKDAYRMSTQQAAMRSTREVPADSFVPDSMKVGTVFNTTSGYRARVKIFGRDLTTGRFTSVYREWSFDVDRTVGDLQAETKAAYMRDTYPSELGLSEIFSTRVQVVFRNERS